MSDEFPDEDLQTDDAQAQPDTPDEKIEDFEESESGQQPEPVAGEPEADEPTDNTHDAPVDEPIDEPAEEQAEEQIEEQFEEPGAQHGDGVDEAFDEEQAFEPEAAEQPAEDDEEEAAFEPEPAEEAEEFEPEGGLDEEPSEAVVVPDSPLADELESVMNPTEPEPVEVEPLPQVGPAAEPAYVELWHDGQKQDTLTLAFDELVFGLANEDADEPAEQPDAEPSAGPPETPPAQPEELPEDMTDEDLEEKIEAEAEEPPEEEPAKVETETEQREPDIDFGEYGIDEDVWRNHFALHRRNRHHFVYTLADATIQLNDEPLSLGDSRELTDGDIIVANEQTALVFRTST